MAIRIGDIDNVDAMKTLIHDSMLGVRTAIPGTIKALNLEDGALKSVDVQPAIRQTISSEDGLSSSTIDLPILHNVPVIMPWSTSQGFRISIPIAVDDKCILLCCDRSIDLWQSTGRTSNPVETITPRTHQLTDSIALIGVSTDALPIPDYNQDSIDISNSDGSTKIEITNDSITLTQGSATIELSGGNIDINATSVTINGINWIHGHFLESAPGLTEGPESPPTP